MLGAFRKEGVGAGVEFLLLHFVGAVIFGTGTEREPFERFVGDLGAAHQAALGILPLLVFRNPVGVLHGMLEIIGPELGLDATTGVVAFVYFHFGPVFAGRKQVNRNNGVAVFTLGNHVLLVHATVGDVHVQGQDVLEDVRGVAETEVVAAQVVVVDNAAGVGDGGRQISLAAFRSGGDSQGVHFVESGLEKVARVILGRRGQFLSPAVVGTRAGGAIGVLEFRHDVCAGEHGAVAVVNVQTVFASLLGGNDDDTVGGIGTIQGGGGRSGKHGNAFDVLLVQGTQYVTRLSGTGENAFRLGPAQRLHGNTVNDVQGVVVVGDGFGAAHHDTRGTAHAGRGLVNGNARHLAVQAVDERTHRRDALQLGLLYIVGEGFFLFFDAHGRDDGCVERNVGAGQGYIDDRTVPNRFKGVFLADEGEPQLGNAGRYGDFIVSVEVGDYTQRRSDTFSGYAGADERFTVVIQDSSRDGPVLGHGESSCDKQSDKGE